MFSLKSVYLLPVKLQIRDFANRLSADLYSQWRRYLLDTRVQKLSKKMGFNEYEITPFSTDILFLINKNGCNSKMKLNAELESLGWGVSVLDDVIFKRISSLVSPDIA